MRTTLNIDEDVLLLVKQVAAREGLTVGQVVSRLVRQGAGVQASITREERPRGRFALLGARDEVITAAHIRELMESEGI